MSRLRNGSPQYGAPVGPVIGTDERDARRGRVSRNWVEPRETSRPMVSGLFLRSCPTLGKEYHAQSIDYPPGEHHREQRIEMMI